MPAWHGLPDRGLSATAILQGLEGLGVHNRDGTVLWFQHEFGIWQDDGEFTGMLRGLDVPRIVTLHTLRFQSPETPSGLCQREHDLLRHLLPRVDAVTVFTEGVYGAVTAAFPGYRSKVYILRHAVHDYPHISRMGRQEAKRALHAFLVRESGLDVETRRALQAERVLLDPDVVVLGQTGFLHPIKGSEFLFLARDALQRLLPDRRVAAIRIGSARLPEHGEHVRVLRKRLDGSGKFLLDVFLPPHVLPLAQRAFDFNYYWPSDCTQSGMLAHALGAGAVVAGRDLESAGETLKNAGALCDTDPHRLLLAMRDVIVDPRLGERIEASAARYAAGISWRRQAGQHCDLARRVLAAGTPLPTALPVRGEDRRVPSS